MLAGQRTVSVLHHTHVPTAMCKQGTSAFFLCFEGGQWSLLPWLVPRRKLRFIWCLQTDQKNLVKIKWIIPDDRRLYALGRVVYLPFSSVSTEEGFQREKLHQNAEEQVRNLCQPTDQGYAHLLNCVIFSFIMEYIYLYMCTYGVLAVWVTFMDQQAVGWPSDVFAV